MKLTVKKDPVKGRGIYALSNIKSNVVLEKCHLLILHESEVHDLLDRYVFSYSKHHVALALGNGSLYNHSSKPNAYCYFTDDREQLIFETLRPIKKGEEILINYGYSKKDLKRFKIES